MSKVLNRKVAIVSVGVLLLLSVILLTYALWSRNFTQSGTNTINTDCFNIEYSQTDAVTFNNAYPQTDEDGLKNVPFTVTIENTCSTIATYSVLLNEMTGNTLAESNIKVAVNDNYKMLNTYEAATPSADVDNANSARKLMTGILPGNTTKSISVKAWIDENTSELEGSNKTFAYRITIETSAGTQNLLAAEILKTPITTTAINYGQLPVSGLYAANDNDGESYFYRGNINNNYVDLGLTYSQSFPLFVIGNNKYSSWIYDDAESQCREGGKHPFYEEQGYASEEECIADIQDYSISAGDPILFRIMRINGDGSIRLISDGPIGASDYNSTATENEQKYAGYTYDNSKVCTNVSPCDGTEGTSSTIKSYLDNWYTTNIASTSLNNKIATSIYCNDTTYTGTDPINYGSSTRLTAGMPSLVCPVTNVTYGGLYKLKVGLPSADEVKMAGYGWVNGPISNYMYIYRTFMIGSPISFSHDGYAYFIFASEFGSFEPSPVSDGDLVRPVINLVADAIIASGNGTKNNPYQIDLN